MLGTPSRVDSLEVRGAEDNEALKPHTRSKTVSESPIDTSHGRADGHELRLLRRQERFSVLLNRMRLGEHRVSYRRKHLIMQTVVTLL